MGTLNIFQQYSQEENTITNNALLLFSRLYENNPQVYEDFINGLLGDENIFSVVPNFQQQVGRGGNGIVDGHIESKSSMIIIETKISGKDSRSKLLSYCDRFKDSDSKILLHLSKTQFSPGESSDLEIEMNKVVKGIRFFSVTFEDIVGGLKELKRLYPYDKEIGRLCDDFDDYCVTTKLYSYEAYTMRAVTCGDSEYLNRQYAFYFDPEHRYFRPHKYLGIYYNKSVRYIGEIKAIVDAELVNGEVNIKNVVYGKMTSILEKNLTDGYKHSVKDGWKIEKGHKFFLCEELFETDFKKSTPYGIYSKRYFDLRTVLGCPTLPEIKKIAEDLKMQSWK